MTAADAFRRRCIAEAYRALADWQEAEARRLEAAERDAAMTAALAKYSGALTTRATALAADLAEYAARGWLRERNLECLSASALPKRKAWHRVLRSRDGELIAWRRTYDIARICNFDRVTLQIEPCSPRETETGDLR